MQVTAYPSWFSPAEAGDYLRFRDAADWTSTWNECAMNLFGIVRVRPGPRCGEVIERPAVRPALQSALPDVAGSHATVRFAMGARYAAALPPTTSESVRWWGSLPWLQTLPLFEFPPFLKSLTLRELLSLSNCRRLSGTRVPLAGGGRA